MCASHLATPWELPYLPLGSNWQKGFFTSTVQQTPRTSPRSVDSDPSYRDWAHELFRASQLNLTHRSSEPLLPSDSMSITHVQHRNSVNRELYGVGIVNIPISQMHKLGLPEMGYSHCPEEWELRLKSRSGSRAAIHYTLFLGTCCNFNNKTRKQVDTRLFSVHSVCLCRMKSKRPRGSLCVTHEK